MVSFFRDNYNAFQYRRAYSLLYWYSLFHALQHNHTKKVKNDTGKLCLGEAKGRFPIMIIQLQSPSTTTLRCSPRLSLPILVHGLLSSLISVTFSRLYSIFQFIKHKLFSCKLRLFFLTETPVSEFSNNNIILFLPIVTILNF